MNEAQFLRRYDALRRLLDVRSEALGRRGRPADLHDGCRYVLGAGGKRIRSVLLVLACEAVGGKRGKALDAGVAIETLHNFTLVHDDIMDNAASRRGKPTVHTRWNVNTALLVGDVLVGLAYESLFRTGAKDPVALASILTETLIVVCEGQAMDMEFERRTDVSVKEYFQMIEKKTGRLISAATEMGAMIGGGTPAQVRSLRTFGHYLGRAFQLQDDLLDILATEQELGKPIGGDIIEGKKTFLLLTAAERAQGKDRDLLARILCRDTGSAGRQELIEAVRDMYERYGVLDTALNRIRRDTQSAVRALKGLPATDARGMFGWLAEALVHRAS